MVAWSMLWILACKQPVLCWDGSELSDTGCPEYTEDTASPELPTLPATTLSADEVAPTLQALIAAELPEMDSLAAVFESTLAQMDDNCPGQDGTMFAIDEACTAASGYTYYGVCTWGTIEQQMGDQNVWVYGSGLTSLEITDPDGHTFVAGGTALFESTWNDYRLEWALQIKGTFHYPPADSWLRNRVSASLEYRGAVEDGANMMELTGGFAFEDQSVYFDALTWQLGCQEPAGSIQLRDPAGVWFSLTLPDDCSGCGTVSLADQPVGEGCVAIGDQLSSIYASMDPQ